MSGAKTAAAVRIVDTWAAGFSWATGGDDPIDRRSHALLVDGGVWLIDPVDGDELDAHVAKLGTPRGVVTLLDRHQRDANAIAARHSIPLYVPAGRRRQQLPASATAYDLAIPDLPLVVLHVQSVDYLWLERALWWPEHKVLVVGDCLGAAGYYRGEDALGVHPLLRLTPPQELRGLQPARILLGHGDPVTEGAPLALEQALDTARSGIPQLGKFWASSLVRKGGHWLNRN